MVLQNILKCAHIKLQSPKDKQINQEMGRKVNSCFAKSLTFGLRFVGFAGKITTLHLVEKELKNLLT